ncbi:MAG: TraR/DksA C4-type zinc finger protein [Verrucomicrobiota bacterium]
MPKKKTAKKVAKKKAAAKKSPSKATKAAAKPAKKAPATKKKSSGSSTATTKPGPRFPILGKKNAFAQSTRRAPIKPRKLSKSFLTKQQQKLEELREHILEQMHGVAQDSLRSPSDSAGSAFGMHQADAGSDAYEKDFALSLLSQEQDALYEIEEAIKRLETDEYGICEMSGEQIPTERLEAIPFARLTVECQAKLEKEMNNRGRWESTSQMMKSSEGFFEDSDNSLDDEVRQA